MFPSSLGLISSFVAERCNPSPIQNSAMATDLIRAQVYHGHLLPGGSLGMFLLAAGLPYVRFCVFFGRWGGVGWGGVGWDGLITFNGTSTHT